MPAAVTQQDRVHLRRALELAEGGRGRVSPNPLVGAVLVRDGEAIGEGFHAELGGPHAEVAALETAGPAVTTPSGATLYVTLEPCAHQGRQPPCTDAILAAGIARVVIASEDPSEKASGRGPGILRDEGIEVELANGEEAAAARLLNQPFRKHPRTGSPARRPQVGPQPRRSGGDGGRRLEVDLGRGQPGAGSPLAGGVRRRVRRDRHGARRRPAAHRPRPRRPTSASPPGSSSTPRRGCRWTRGWSARSQRRRCS